jgi:hypothetical protein
LPLRPIPSLLGMLLANLLLTKVFVCACMVGFPI